MISKLYNQTSSFYSNADLYNAEADFFEDIPFWKRFCKKRGGKVLELACGTGRVGLSIIESGLSYDGLDFSYDFVRFFKEKIKGKKTSSIKKGDMRNFSLNKKFDTIIMPYNSLAHLYNIKDLIKCFTCVKNHLKKEGQFAFQIFNPDVVFMTSQNDPVFLGDFETEKGESFQLWEENDYDRATQINSLEWTYEFDDGRVLKKKNSMRMFFPQEIDSILSLMGLKIVKKYGDFKKSKFSNKSNLQIIVATNM